MSKHNDNFITLNKYPTLYVKEFGKIKEAEIELAPFTLFVGDNNSGKSYLLNLIWGLQKEIFRSVGFLSIARNKHIEKEAAYIDIFNKLKSIIDLSSIKKEHKKIDLNLGETDINNIMTLINKMLHENKDNFIKSLFNSDDISVNELSLLIPKDANMEFSILANEIDGNFTRETFFIECSVAINETVIEHGFFLPNGDGEKTYDDDKLFKSIVNVLVQHILFTLFPSTFPFLIKVSAFFPTSRTGFLLAYRELAKNAISDKYQIPISNDDNLIPSSKESVIFLNSTVSFIQMLFNFDSKNNASKIKDIIEYIEKDIIHGKLEMHSETGEFLYTPDKTKVQLKMHMTSAVVTELAPLILYLKYHSLTNAMFMEEPEISLHPELQQKITRVLIKLIKHTNQQVFIATHSDTITQHINNMIKLKNNDEDRQKELLKKFGYDENDMISQDRVRMYQFDIDNETHKTLVRPLASSKYGFRTPTFGNFLDNMSDQIDELLEEL